MVTIYFNWACACFVTIGDPFQQNDHCLNEEIIIKKVLFFEPGFSATTSPILHSQFLKQAAVLSELGADCFFFGADSPENVTPERINELKEKFSLAECHVVPVVGHGKNWRTVQKSVKRSAIILRREISRISPNISYSWIMNAAVELEEMGRAKTGKTLFFCQGASSEEVRLKGRLTRQIRAIYLSSCEHRIFPKCDRIISVSENMKNWVQGIAQRVPGDILPCCFDSERFKPMPNDRSLIRDQLGWSNAVPVVIYSGGVSNWQRLPDIVQLLAQAQQKMPELHLIFLSGAENQVREYAHAAGLVESQLEIRSVSHDEVPLWLNAADAGIVLRHDNLVNRVASPIKIGEYLGCGLPVIATDCIGDYSQKITEANAGLVLREPISAELVVRFLQDRASLKTCALNALNLSREFSWEAGKRSLSHIFELH